MLHLFTNLLVTENTQRPSLVTAISCMRLPIHVYPPKHSSKLTSQWLVFVSQFQYSFLRKYVFYATMPS